MGFDDKHINTIDFDCIFLAALNGLYEMSQEQKAEIDNLQERVTQLMTLVETILAQQNEDGKELSMNSKE